MLRHLASSARRAGPRAVRAFADDAAGAGPDAGAESRHVFLEKIKPLLSSTSAPPSFPTDFAPKPKGGEEGEASAGGVPDKLSFSCYLPHGQPMDREPVRVLCVWGGCGRMAAAPSAPRAVCMARAA